MKKMIVFAAVLVAAVMTKGAQVDWLYAADSADAGKTVYVLLGTTAVSEWESKDALTAASIGSGTVGKSGRTYSAGGTASSKDLTKGNANIYYVVVASDEKTFDVTSVADMTASVYDPAAQESSLGDNKSLSSASITKSGLAWGSGSDPVVPTPTPIDPSGVPEPTSGLLLLVGGAALALRRKQK